MSRKKINSANAIVVSRGLIFIKIASKQIIKLYLIIITKGI